MLIWLPFSAKALKSSTFLFYLSASQFQFTEVQEYYVNN